MVAFAQSAAARGAEPPTEVAISTPLPRLLDLLHLDEIAHDVFRAATVFDDPMNLYGGQVAAQALRAAGITVPQGRVPHSLHCYFLRAGDPLKPVDYHVHRDRDGRAYSARTVSAMQDGREILTMSTSFHVVEDGPDVQPSGLPAVAGPEDPACRDFTGRTLDIVYRDPEDGPRDHMIRRVWAKASVDLGDDPLLHACVVTYVSDMFTGLFSLVPRRDDVALSSLDHVIWFLRDARADAWMFMELHGESLHGGRGLYSGDMYDRDGALIAKLVQESLFRPRVPRG